MVIKELLNSYSQCDEYRHMYCSEIDDEQRLLTEGDWVMGPFAV